MISTKLDTNYHEFVEESAARHILFIFVSMEEPRLSQIKTCPINVCCHVYVGGFRL